MDVRMRVLLSAFQCAPNRGSEPGNGWHWATSLAAYGHDVTVLTTDFERPRIVEANPQGIDFRFIELPKSALRPVSARLGLYHIYRRRQAETVSPAPPAPRAWHLAPPDPRATRDPGS